MLIYLDTHTDRYTYACCELHKHIYTYTYIAHTDRYIHTYIQIQTHIQIDITPKYITDVLNCTQICCKYR